MAADEHLGLQFTHSYDDVVVAGNDPFPADKWGHTGRYALTQLHVPSVAPEHSMDVYRKMDEEHDEPYEQRSVQRMAAHLQAGGELPPVLAHRHADVEVPNALSDGYHRLMAHRLAGREHIRAYIPEIK